MRYRGSDVNAARRLEEQLLPEHVGCIWGIEGRPSRESTMEPARDISNWNFEVQH